LSLRPTALDGALLLMVLIWGSNFTVVKLALRDFPEIAFNAGRMAVSGVLFLAVITRPGARPSLTRADWIRVALLGVVGTFLYQFMFVSGLKRTSAGNGALIVGISPVMIAILSAFAGHERVPPRRWFGVLLAFCGLYFVVGQRADWSAGSFVGDGMVIASMVLWSSYSVAAQPLLKRHSPLTVTGLSFSIGAGLYLLCAAPFLIGVDWRAVSVTSWVLMTLSAVLALNVSYVIWYTGLQKLGGTRTSIYSYLTPIVAMIVASFWLGEPITINQVVGAGAILAGLFVTRFA
jgi:drug/metabolite transporter (DMT)-like permease